MEYMFGGWRGLEQIKMNKDSYEKIQYQIYEEEVKVLFS